MAESLIYSEWLFQQAYDRAVKWYDYWPIWVMSALAVSAVAFALWYFGQNNRAAYLVADILFALAIAVVVIGLIVLAALIGGGLHTWKGKTLFGLLGLWHAVLQILVPFLLVKRGTWLSFLLALVSIFVFGFFGSVFVRYHSRWLALVWVVYGVWLLYLPLISTRPPWIPQDKWPLLGLVVSGAVGLLMTCVSLGWYFAVSLTYQGHNNEAGGAARIEEFKEFMRIRITPQGLTAYVIGFDHPQTEGHLLKPKLLDMFHLR
jgi:hypothetical protein